MIQQFLAQSFLLSEHTVYETLAQELLNAYETHTLQRWSVVCERKEDLLSIRTQLFSLLKQNFGKKYSDKQLQAWAGVSLYTPDTLVRNFALTLSHNSSMTLGEENFRLMRNPFLDVVEQERLTRLLLLKLGYTGSDLAPLAKQILTLSDTQLPRDETFFSVLLEVQKIAGSLKSISDVPDLSLRTICVAYQLLQKINTSFCRLQSFVKQYWTTSFKSHLQAKIDNDEQFKNFLLPQRFLSEPLLWVAAPEYARDETALKNNNTYRPGNFQAHWIDSLRSVLFESRDLFAAQHVKTLNNPANWWARTIIPTETLVPEKASAEVHILGHQAALEYHLNTLQAESRGHSRFLLGDVNSSAWNIGRSDGSGVHALSPADFEKYLSEKEQNSAAISVVLQEDDKSRWQNPATTRIANLHEEFKRDWQRLDSFTNLIQEALNQYDLSPSLRKHGVSFNLLLHRFFDAESFTVGDLGIASTLPPALSFLPGLKKPEEFCVVGHPHSPTTPSFHLRVLNAVFHHLRSKQITLDPIASEQAYRGYWQSFFSRPEKIRFILKGISQLRDIPEYAKPWCLPPTLWNIRSRENTTESLFKKSLNSQRAIHDTAWTRLLPEQPSHGPITLAVTAFEDYVECPLKFYWLNLHKISPNDQAHLQPDRLLLGQRAHAVAETFLRTLRHLLLLENPELNKGQRWREMISSVNTHFVERKEFISTSAEEWIDGLARALTGHGLSGSQLNHVQAMVLELRQAIFEIAPGIHEKSKSPAEFAQLQHKLTREGVRRAFKKLIQSELQIIGTEQESSFVPAQGNVFAAFLEEPISFPINNKLTLAGRIDRIDTHPQGDSIIDYKTSKVPKTDRELVLLPSMACSTHKLSVQGAIYSMAWAEKLAQEDSYHARGVRSFSLLRLKTLDLERNPKLSFEFETPLNKKSEVYDNIHQEYALYAQKLAAGEFPAQPLLKETCSTCPLSTLCPTASPTDGSMT